MASSSRPTKAAPEGIVRGRFTVFEESVMARADWEAVPKLTTSLAEPPRGALAPSTLASSLRQHAASLEALAQRLTAAPGSGAPSLGGGGEEGATVASQAAASTAAAAAAAAGQQQQQPVQVSPPFQQQ